MREILFRGKCQRGYDYSNGDGWVYGSLLQKGNLAAIVKTEDIESCFGADDGISSIEDFACIPVEPNTIGQFTGLTDKNGTKIFEGDIVKYNVYKHKFIGAVVFDKCHFLARGTDVDYRLTRLPSNANIEVVGNIHDNRNLLK